MSNNDSGTFVLDSFANGRPDPNAGKQYGKALYNDSDIGFEIVDRSEYEGQAIVSDGQVHSKRLSSDAGTFTLKMDAGQQMRPGAHFRPNDMVSYKGTQVSAKVAANMGILVADGNGGFYVPFDRAGANQQYNTPASRQQNQETPHQQDNKPELNNEGNKEAPEGMEPLGQEVEDHFTDTLTKITPASAHQTLLELSNGEGFTEGMINRLSNESGMSPEETKTVAENLYAKFETQARQSVEGMGLDADTLFDWARENQPDMMQQAMQRHGAERTTKGYQEVAQAYLLELPSIDPDQILEAEFGEGITAAREGKNIIIHSPQGSHEWKTLVRAGYIKLSKRSG